MSDLTPYEKLKSIVNDEHYVSDNASKNLDDLLGIKREEKKPEGKSNSLLKTIINFFKKIDSKIFKKSDKRWNTGYHKRKR